MTRAAHPQLTFADLEFIRQGIDMDENLKKISEFLDAQPEVLEMVRQDLQRGLKNPKTGRNPWDQKKRRPKRPFHCCR